MGWSVSLKLTRSVWAAEDLGWLERHCETWQDKLSAGCEPYRLQQISPTTLVAHVKPGQGKAAASDCKVLVEAGRELEAQYPDAVVEWDDGFERRGAPSSFDLAQLFETLREEHGEVEPESQVWWDETFANVRETLGLLVQHKLAVYDGPPAFIEVLAHARTLTSPESGLDVQIAFVTSKTDAVSRLVTMNQCASANGTMWVSIDLRNTASFAPNEEFVRFAAVELGLRETQVARLNKHRIALRFERRKTASAFMN